MAQRTPFKYFLKTSPEIIRLVVMLYVRFPLSFRNVETLAETGSNPSDSTVHMVSIPLATAIPAEDRSEAELVLLARQKNEAA